MKLPRFVRVAPGVCALVCLWSAPVLAADWQAAAGDMGRNESRIALDIGGSWALVSGDEVEKVNPATGFEVGAAFRFFRSASLYGAFASSKSTVDGQIVALIDQPVRADGRSGNVSGDVTFTRYRAGLRIDGMRQERWPAQVYFIGAAVFVTTKVAIDTVDQATPAPIPALGGGMVDLGGFEDSQVGFMGRVGMEYSVAPRVGVDLGFTYEVFEAPPGTSSAAGFHGGVTFRI